MSYQVYRNTTLGTTLQDSLDELMQQQQISPQLKSKVLEEVLACLFHTVVVYQLYVKYDRAINNALATRVRNRINFKGQLNTYRFCDNVWTFVIEDAEFREGTRDNYSYSITEYSNVHLVFFLSIISNYSLPFFFVFFCFDLP